MSRGYRSFQSQKSESSQPGRPDLDQAYLERALEALKANPELISRVEENLQYFRQQKHLPKSASASLRRFEYLLAVTKDPVEIERRVMENSYEGRKFRQLPLMFKGVA